MYRYESKLEHSCLSKGQAAYIRNAQMNGINLLNEYYDRYVTEHVFCELDKEKYTFAIELINDILDFFDSKMCDLVLQITGTIPGKTN